MKTKKVGARFGLQQVEITAKKIGGNKKMKTTEKTIRISNRQAYNHGCQNEAYLVNNGDGTFTVTDVTSCRSCHQVGHDNEYVYASVGDVWTEEELLTSNDYRWELED